MSKRIHLCHYNDGRTDMWEILDEARDYIGAMSDEKVSRTFTEDIMQADSLTGLLLQMRDAESTRFYVAKNTIYNDGTEKSQKFPEFMALYPIKGYDRRVLSGISQGEDGKSYISELWTREGDTLQKVHGFDMREELFETCS